MKTIFLIFVVIGQFAFAKGDPRKPAAQSVDQNQFLELVNGKLKGAWLEVAAMGDLPSTTAKYAEDTNDYLTTLSIRMNYLKVIKNCSELVQMGDAVLLCKVK